MVGRTLSIRRATQRDASVIADLGARTFEASYGADNRPEDMEQYLASSFSTKQIEAEISDPASTFLLALEEGEAIGYARLRDGESPPSVNGPRPVELVRIYVEHEAIGKGYGSALMAACLETAASNGHQTIWLGVWVRNEQAIGFYEKCGFAKAGTRNSSWGAIHRPITSWQGLWSWLPRHHADPRWMARCGKAMAIPPETQLAEGPGGRAAGGHPRSARARRIRPLRPEADQ